MQSLADPKHYLFQGHKLPKCPKTMGQKNNFPTGGFYPLPAAVQGPEHADRQAYNRPSKPQNMESSTYIEGVLQLMGQIAPLPEPFQQRIASQLKAERLPAKTLMLRPGQTARRVYYIKKGFIRSYFLDGEGREHTTGFAGENQLLTSTASFLLQQPADEYVQVLAEAELLSISYHQLQSYYADFPQGNLIGRILVERHFAQAESRSRLLRYKSPQQRYQQLLCQHPNIEQLTTTAHIASYLGINRETLSPTRSKILKTSAKLPVIN